MSVSKFVISSALLMPLLHMFLMLSLATSLCGAKFDRLLASLYSFAEPVTAAALSTWLLGSPFTGWDALGFVCIFVMLVLLSLRKDPAPQPQPARS